MFLLPLALVKSKTIRGIIKILRKYNLPNNWTDNNQILAINWSNLFRNYTISYNFIQ